MNLFEDLEKVLSKTVDEVVSTDLILTLLRLYSRLYLDGGTPTMCGNCHRDMYRMLSLNGKTKIIQYMEREKRTCKPAWKDLVYIRLEAKHFHADYITDKQAYDLLKSGYLKESQFEVLPESWLDYLATLETPKIEIFEPKKQSKTKKK